MRALSVVVLLVIGCVTEQSAARHYAQLSAGHVGCHVEDITTSAVTIGGHLSQWENWEATCRGRVFVCAKSPYDLSCAPLVTSP